MNYTKDKTIATHAINVVHRIGVIRMIPYSKQNATRANLL